MIQKELQWYYIIKSVNNKIANSVIFVDGPGGYRKTFCLIKF